MIPARMSRVMLTLLMPLVLMFGPALFAQQVQEKATASPEFERMKSLLGSWKGTDPKGAPVDVSYKLVSEGTAIMEVLGVEGHAENMVTMYHLDNGRLMGTHYCSMGNQPRLQLNAGKSSDSTLVFTFRDATNMQSVNDPHIHGLTIIFRDKTHFAQEWVSMADGKEQRETFSYSRVK